MAAGKKEEGKSGGVSGGMYLTKLNYSHDDNC